MLSDSLGALWYRDVDGNHGPFCSEECVDRHKKGDVNEKNTEWDWTIRGTAHVSGLDALPNVILDMHEVAEYAVFSDGETLLLKPVDEVEP